MRLPFVRFWKRLALAGVLALLGAAPAWGQDGAPPSRAPEEDCSTGLICVSQSESRVMSAIHVRNTTAGPVSVRFNVEGTNVKADVALPYLAVFEPGEAKQAFVVHPQNVMSAWSYRFSYEVMQGNLQADHNDNYAYALPYPPGATFEVMQGYDGSFSHQDLYAIDWAMPEGTPVHAARGGRVIAVQEDMDGSGLDEQYKHRANYILILHDDGTTASYVHLQRDGALVEPGDTVFRGQVIGRSGNTGYSSDPHLHFEVGTIDKNINSKTIPVRFDLGSGPPVQVQPRTRYTAPRQ